MTLRGNSWRCAWPEDWKVWSDRWRPRYRSAQELGPAWLGTSEAYWQAGGAFIMRHAFRKLLTRQFGAVRVSPENAHPSRPDRFCHHFLLLRRGSWRWLLSQRQDKDFVRFPAFQA